MLRSARIAEAPNLAHVLSLQSARADLPNIPAPSGETNATVTTLPPNDLQKSLVTASAVQHGEDPAQALSRTPTRRDAIDYFTSLLSR